METLKRSEQQQQRESMITYILNNHPTGYLREQLESLADSDLNEIFEQIVPGKVELDSVQDEANDVRFGPDGKPNPHRRGTRLRHWD